MHHIAFDAFDPVLLAFANLLIEGTDYHSVYLLPRNPSHYWLIFKSVQLRKGGISHIWI